MSSRSPPVELDFFRMERESLPPSPSPPPRRSSFKDIQREVSKLNPEVLKSIFASAAVEPNYSAPSDAAFGKKNGFSASELNAKQMGCAPMTIFYNGTVAVFDVSQHQAENILQMAQQGFSKMCIHPKQHLPDPIDLLQCFTGGGADLPLARRRSLKHFLERRKERLTMVSSPYGCPFPNHHNSARSSSSPSLSLSLYPDEVYSTPLAM